MRAYSFALNKYTEWDIPAYEELLAHSKSTWGKKFDRVEREVVEGGLPYVIPIKPPKIGY